MTEILTQVGYEQTKDKLAKLEERLAKLGSRSHLSPQHRSEAQRSYEDMIAQYRREIKLYEESHSENATK
jgi:BMFP domain-containing protein YqiC